MADVSNITAIIGAVAISGVSSNIRNSRAVTAATNADAIIPTTNLGVGRAACSRLQSSTIRAIAIAAVSLAIFTLAVRAITSRIASRRGSAGAITSGTMTETAAIVSYVAAASAGAF